MPSRAPSQTHALSLPQSFRYNPPTISSPLPNHRSFFISEDTDDPSQSPAPSVHTTCAKTRLEILKGWEVNFAILCLYTASTIALVYLLIVLHRVHQSWSMHSTLPTLSAPELAFRALLQFGSAILPIFFALSLLASRAVTDEQIWTSILLTLGLLATNPLINATITDLNQPPDSLVLNDAIYTAVVYLYLILAAHSYREFSETRLHSFAFYAPKLAMALLYLIVKVVTGLRFGVALGLVPYSRLLSWLILRLSGRSSLRITIPVLLTTLLDTAFGFWLVREVATTAFFLARVPYVENRTKQLGFRCFVYQTLAFCFNMIGLSILITCLLPRDLLYDTFDNPQSPIFQLEPPIARLSLAFVYFTWTLVLAYVNLPASSTVPFLKIKVRQALYLVRNSRVAVWMGLADIADTEDAEDSSDEEEEIVIANPSALSPDTMIPFRYRHREMFDETASTSSRNVVSPLVLSAKPPVNIEHDAAALGHDDLSPDILLPQRQSETVVSFDMPGSNSITVHGSTAPPMLMRQNSSSDAMLRTQPISITPTPQDLNASVFSPPNQQFMSSMAGFGLFPPTLQPQPSALKLRSLRLRKNLFVMETQILLSNAAYLSYIPGNRKEELLSHPEEDPTNHPPPLHVGSLANDLNDLARQIEEENLQLSMDPITSQEGEIEEMQPEHDDGTMFRVDPYETAKRYGYCVYKHIRNEELNTHAIVLVDATRVIVSFSGTRDVRNWGFNANIKRVVLDEKLSRFEYELSSDASKEPDAGNEDCEDSAFDFRHWRAHPHGKVPSSEQRKLRRSRSYEGSRNWSLDTQRGDAADGHESKPTYFSYGATDHADDVRRVASARDNRVRWHEYDARVSLATTQGVTEVASTFARELMTFGQAKVHEGFINAYLSLRKEIMGALVELYHGRAVQSEDISGNHRELGVAKNLPLFFCGHSMGGAMATFASYEAARYYKRIGLRRRQDVSCTTFGCPRIGNEAFKARYERLVETHWRFEMACDPIPTVPNSILNYVHVGVQVLLDQSGMLLIDPSFIEVEWWSKLGNLYIGYRLHTRASYCMALRTYCKLYNSGIDDLGDRFWPFPIRVQTRGLFPNV